MNGAVVDWLPRSALADPRIKTMVVEEIGRWNLRWFGDRAGYSMSPFSVAKSMQRPASAGEKWIELPGGLACRWTDKQAIALAKRIVDAESQRQLSAATDNILLLALAKEALSDLAMCFVKLSGIAADEPWNEANFEKFGGLQFILGTSKTAEFQLRIALPMNIAARLKKSLIGSSFEPAPLDGRLADAVGFERLNVKVHIGSCRISARALYDLSPGDVVILDTPIDGTFPMVSESSGEQICHLQLSQDDGPRALRVAD